VIVEIQCLPQPAGASTDRYAHVDAAIAVIQASGLRCEVGALGTTLEGEPDQVWPLLRRVHEACLAAGAEHVVSVVKLAQAAGPSSQVTMDGLTASFRTASGS
jgi:uncharacterized protein YqgV (UPF0045/DUF77 family)